MSCLAALGLSCSPEVHKLYSWGAQAPEHTGSVAAARQLSCSECGIWDLSFLIRDQTHIPWIGRQILSHWTTREAPTFPALIIKQQFGETMVILLRENTERESQTLMKPLLTDEDSCGWWGDPQVLGPQGLGSCTTGSPLGSRPS